MRIEIIGQWSTTAGNLGNVSDGDVREVDDFLADQLIQRGYAREYLTKVEPLTPKKPEPLPVIDVGSSQAARPVRKPRKSRKYATKAE